ncbi:DUF4307 domain-containing protein [Rhodococcus aerolatus]
MPDVTPDTRPEGRYSRPRAARGPSRWTLVVTTLAVLVGLGVAYLAYTNLAQTPVQGEQTGFELTDASTLTLRFDVTRSDPAAPAVCIVRARSLDGSETGRREVLVGPGTDAITSVTTEVKTSAPPVAGDVYGCSLTVPPWFAGS